MGNEACFESRFQSNVILKFFEFVQWNNSSSRRFYVALILTLSEKGNSSHVIKTENLDDTNYMHSFFVRKFKKKPLNMHLKNVKACFSFRENSVLNAQNGITPRNACHLRLL